MKNPGFRVAQKIFVTNKNGQILTMKFSQTEPEQIRGTWDFPGGGVEYKEDLREALLREIREELGPTVKVKIGKPIAVWSFMTAEGNKYCVAIGYEAQWLSGTIHLSNEHDEYQWINPDKLLSLKWRDGHHDGAQQYLAGRMKHEAQN
jgi:8-oxo-dGTP diphosphatase